MNSVNSLQLFLLVWTFTAVGRADDDLCSVSCKNVTGTVGEEITLICNVSQKCSESCITLYKFYYPEIYNDSICKQNNSCEQRNSFTCRYTPTTVMTGKHGFFLQTQKAVEITEFTVNITEAKAGESFGSKKEEGSGSQNTVIGSVAGCFIILILILILILIIIIIMKIICKNKTYSKPCGFQRRKT